MLLIRADGNAELGAGHVMRCGSVAHEAMAAGTDVLFAVSDDASARMVHSIGFPCEIVGGSCKRFGSADADALLRLGDECGTGSVLVDSYAVNDDFFGRLRDGGFHVTYIDDAYAFETGFLEEPKRWDVSTVVNYSFGYEQSSYEAIYGGYGTECHVGPAYAPVRGEFRGRHYEARDHVRRVLITSGATNPSCALERMLKGCFASLPEAEFIVVVGHHAEFRSDGADWANVNVLHDVEDMAGLMESCDIALTAAGTTLYELSCIGVPMMVMPVVENQIANARGVRKLGVGLSTCDAGWTIMDIAAMVEKLTESTELRRGFSLAARSQVDGFGARRIAKIAINAGAF